MSFFDSLIRIINRRYVGPELIPMPVDIRILIYSTEIALYLLNAMKNKQLTFERGHTSGCVAIRCKISLLLRRIADFASLAKKIFGMS